jgi:hypothetical protein
VWVRIDLALRERVRAEPETNSLVVQPTPAEEARGMSDVERAELGRDGLDHHEPEGANVR